MLYSNMVIIQDFKIVRCRFYGYGYGYTDIYGYGYTECSMDGT